MNKIIEIAQTILAELDSIESELDRLNDNDELGTPIYYNNYNVPIRKKPEITPQQELQKKLKTLNTEYEKLAKEPFICYVKVVEERVDSEPIERVFLFCRNYIPPPSISPNSDTSSFANRNSPMGKLASLNVGRTTDDIPAKKHGKSIPRKFTILEKSTFRLKKKANWDAIENTISFDENLKSEFVNSTRDLLANLTGSKQSGADLLREIEDLEAKSEQLQSEKRNTKQKLQRSIVLSVSLKDQPILDEFQDEFCRLPLKTTNLLVGSPGTGKTTSIIKRLVFKSDLTHLKETDEIILENHKLQNWVMFTPNELLKVYLKEAMNKEELSATDTQVITWEKERTLLGRDILKFLKTIDTGRFYPIKKNEILTNNTSSGLIEYTKKFIEFFNVNIQMGFSNAVDVLEQNKPSSEIILIGLSLWGEI